MLEFFFRGLVKKLERSAQDVSQDFVKSAGKEVRDLVDDKLSPLADKLDYIAQKSIKQSIDSSRELKDECKADIESLLTNADAQARQALERIDRVRQDAIRDLRETIGQTDIYLENRIDQISLVVMDALTSTKGITEKTLKEINSLEDKLFQDANQLVDKIDEVVEGKLELIRNELRRHLTHALPGPFDKCRQKLKIAWKPGAMLSDIELYELSECYELIKLNENTAIDEVLKTYGQLQLNAARMAALVKNAPELKRRAIEDWLKYGVLCEFWRDTMKSYDSSAPILLEAQMPQKILTDREDA
jgi:enamine deaminase RidA (YjgF/YER057c/UK114 family)